MGFYLKDPGAAIDYTVDWAAGYLAGAEILASHWSVEPFEDGGVIVAADAREAGRTAATLEGGLAGHIYRVCNRIEMSDGRNDERSLVIRVEQR